MKKEVTMIELEENECALILSPSGGRVYMSEKESDEAEEVRWLCMLATHAARSEVVDQRLWVYLNERVTRLMIAMEMQEGEPWSFTEPSKK